MDSFIKIREVLAEILDIEPDGIEPETYVVRDLGAESIDLLEVSVALNSRFKIDVNDDLIFLRTLRISINEATEAGGKAPELLCERFPFLGRERVEEILEDLEGGPVLKVKDLMSYVSRQSGMTK
jgi:acyl carrier protein